MNKASESKKMETKEEEITEWLLNAYTFFLNLIKPFSAKIRSKLAVSPFFLMKVNVEIPPFLPITSGLYMKIFWPAVSNDKSSFPDTERTLTDSL